MRKIIVGMPGCSKCKILKERHPEIEYVEAEPVVIVPLARQLKFAEMPFVVMTGSTEELDELVK